jgi:hypothetical protein
MVAARSFCSSGTAIATGDFQRGIWKSARCRKPPPCAKCPKETGLSDLVVRGELATIDWHFRFRGKLIHKICHFFLMESENGLTSPQREEGITACKWVPIDEALALISYANAREVLQRAAEMVGGAPAAH